MKELSGNKKITCIDCPTCKIKVTWNEESPYRPLCSTRCKQIDLGEWASEGFSIPGNPAIQGLEEPGITDRDDTTHH